MLKRPLTRRTFLAGCTAGAAAACLGAGAMPAYGADGQIGVRARPESDQIHTICQGCPNGCGYTAYVVDGQLGKVIGDASSPLAAGTLCARGFGFTQSAFSSANVKNPLRRREDGKFQTIGWDEALGEIAAKLDEILAGAGPQAVALAYDGLSATAAAYGSRFMQALGSGNIYVDDVTENVNKAAAFTQVIGVGEYIPDIADAQLILLVDTSYADITTPNLVTALQAAREAGAAIVAIDPRMGTLASFADEWIAVNPGTELALLLALCNQLIRDGRYDRAFVEANTSGFDEWAQAIAGCTAAWAQDITGVESYRIESLAAKIAEAAPRMALEYGNGRIGGAPYVNSSETARAACLLNTLAGAWNHKGGALMPHDYSAAAFEAAMGPVPGAPADLALAPAPTDYPLGQPFGASLAQGIDLARLGVIKALFAIEADLAYDYASMPKVSEALESMDLFVCISQQMTQTAQLAHYVLPVCSYLESDSLPLFAQTPEAAASIASAVLVDDDSNALPVDAVITALAEACGVGNAFDFTLDEAASLQLAAVGLDLEGLRADGSAAADAATVGRGKSWPTPTKKIQCVSAACEKAGLDGSPVWTAPLDESNVQAVISDDMNFGQANRTILVAEGAQGPKDLRFHLISGQQSVLGSHGYNVEELVDIAEMYDLDSLWINAEVARVLGIATGDTVVVSNGAADYRGRAFVTQRIVPTAVYLPSYFGHTSEKQHAASGKGFNPALFCEPAIEEGYGTLCMQDALVQLWKEGE